MPEPVPTTDGPKGKGKKLPTWTYIAIPGALIIVFLIYKNKKAKEEEGTGTANPYTAQSFVPVTAENVGGVGAAGGGVSGGGNTEGLQFLSESQKTQNEFLKEFLGSQREAQREEAKGNKEFLEKFSENIKAQTGGGAPASGQVGTGGGAASPESGGTKASPPPPPVGNKCGVGAHAEFPKWNPADGAPSNHSCYRISREKAKKSGYVIHGYQDGREVESR